jgi:cell division protein FtsI/penicillin-binding protein 2
MERRIGVLFAVFLAALLLALLRAGWLGTVRAGELRGRAVAQQEEDLAVPARRGTITDRHGMELAVAEDAASVWANPLLIRDPRGVAEKLAPLVDRPAGDLLEELSDRRRGFVYVRRKLSLETGERVERLRLEGVGTLTEPRRRYPRHTLASQVLGTVGTDNTGLAGIEQAQDERLSGIDGRRRVVKDALGKPVSIVTVRRPEPGRDLRLTLDGVLQERVEAVLSGVGQTWRPKGATALVLDPRTGDLLALANWPPVDPEAFGDASPYARQNRAVSASYEPGSTFKAFTVAGALEEELIEPDTWFSLPPEIKVADRTIGEAHDRGAVSLTVSDILSQSSNVGSVKIGLRLKPRRFDAWVRRFGFGSPTGITLPGESPGIVPRPEDYSGSSLGNLPIGQGLAVTPVQMAAGFSAIASGGVAVRPRILAEAPVARRRVTSRQTADEVARMLEGVLAPGGTGVEARVDGYKLAGKTGTAQKPDPRGGYSADRYVASFIGFAPARDPRLLVAVMVDEPRGEIYGGVVAAPAFEQIVSFALPYLRIPPG